MKFGHIDCIFGGKVKIDDVDKGLENGSNNGGASGCSRNEKGLAIFQYDGGGHGTEHSLVRADGIGFAADGAKHIWHTGFHAEIIHFIVQEKTSMANNYFASVPAVQGGGERNGIAIFIVCIQMCGFVAFADNSRLYFFAFSCGIRIETSHSLPE